jgi:hypothetical protein
MPGKYIKPVVVAAGTIMMLLGVCELAGWWALRRLVPRCFFFFFGMS